MFILDVHLLRNKQLNLKKTSAIIWFLIMLQVEKNKNFTSRWNRSSDHKIKEPYALPLGCLFNMIALQMSILKYFSSVATLKHCKHALPNSLLNLNFFKSIQFVISSYCKPWQLDVYPTNFSWRITYYIIKVILFQKYTYTESKDQNLDLYSTK